MRGNFSLTAECAGSANRRGIPGARCTVQSGTWLAACVLTAVAAACGPGSSSNTSALALYDDFSSGTISGSKWTQGQHQAVLENNGAVLSHIISAARANTAYGTVLTMRPPAAGAVTTLQTKLQLTSANFTRDTAVRTGIDLWFQPVENQLGPTHLANSLFARVSFLGSATNFVVQRQLFECTADDCSTFASVGTPSGNWPGAGLPFVLGTEYVISISIEPATKRFTFSISGGAYSSPRTAVIDTSAVVSPFPVDLSPSNFHRARLTCQVRGGMNGGGDGAVRTHLDNVSVGMNGAPAVLFDDFNSGITFDSTKWTIGKESVQIVASSLQIALSQSDAPASVQMMLADSGVSAMQTDVTVSEWSLSGQGRLVARMEGAFYNDGTNGTGSAPYVNRPGSQVGDVLASINVTASNASYSVIRCDTANCSRFTSIRPAVSLGTVTLGSAHTLLIQWNAGSQQLSFQLDDRPAVTFDPAGAGYPTAAMPNLPFRELAVRAGPLSAADRFTGSITASFDNVKTM